MDDINPQVDRLRGQLIEQIAATMKGLGLSQSALARQFQISLPRVNRIVNRDRTVYALDGLVRIADILGLEVNLTIKKRRGGRVNASDAPAATLSADDAEPVAWVPIHPRTGPIWAEAGPDAREKDNLKSYPFMAVWANPSSTAPAVGKGPQ